MASIIEDAVVARVEHERKTFGSSITEQIVGSRQWVPPDVFLEELGSPLWPKLSDVFNDMYCRNPTVVVARGAIGWGKSFLINYFGCNKLWEISLPDAPATWFGLDPHTKILGIVVSVSGSKAKGTGVYPYAVELAKRAPKWMGIKSYSRFVSFNNKVFLYPGHSQESSVAGDNVYVGFIEEANLLSEAARRAYEDRNVTHAMVLYRALERRIQSRFISHPGLIAMVGHELYPEDFLSQYSEKLKGQDDAVVLKFNGFETRPQKTFENMECFRVFVGSETRGPKVLEDNEVEEEQDLVESVPVVYKSSFVKDIYGCLREILGVATVDTLHRWCTRPTMIDTAAKRPNLWPDSIQASSLRQMSEKLVETLVKACDQGFAYALALDLSRSGDSTGVALGHLEFPDPLTQKDEAIAIDAALAIVPDVSADIMIHEVEALLCELCLRLPIVKFAGDAWQSDAIIQKIGQLGVEAKAISVDKTPVYYRTFLSRLYDDLMLLVKNSILLTELRYLIVDVIANKVDHLPNRSKDIADAVCRIVAMLAGKTSPLIDPGRLIPNEPVDPNDPAEIEREMRGGLVKMLEAGDSLWASDQM